MPRRLRYATLLAFLLHGVLIATGRYRLGYDAYTHMFFADHYRLDWWSLWEPRWYTGFEVVSYPPLVHQLIALAGHIIGVDAGYALLLWAVLTAFPLAVYLYCRVLAGRAVASYAAYGAALLPSLFLAAHVFGQLPTLFATLFALLGVRVLADFLRHGKALNGALAISLFATVTAAHHATLLLLPWLVFAVLPAVFSGHPPGRRLVLARLATAAVLTVAAGTLVVFPFWQWGAQQMMQVPIDHASRHSLIRDPSAAILFFLPMYGLLVPLIPLALWLGMRRLFWAAGLAFASLFLLGLGDTTPLPRLLFGQGWEWLTYDRFAFWASLLLLPFCAAAFVVLRRRLPWWIDARGRSIGVRHQLRRAFISPMTFVALFIGFIPTSLPTQPPQLDMRPIVDFLEQDAHSQWRYVTFGFGNQAAYLSRLTAATTIDGSYHTARTLPELRDSGIGEIDTAFWMPNGLAALDLILPKSGERGVRWGFVSLQAYAPVLARNGWRRLATLSNGVEVWENPSAVRPVPATPPAHPPIASLAWGTLPLLALVTSGLLAALRHRPALGDRILTRVQAMAIGLLPLGLALWYNLRLFAFTHERVYFTYSDALFFLSDGIALVAILAWLAGPRAKLSIKWRSILLRTDGWLLVLCLLATASCLWSLDWRISLYVSLHYWLILGLYVSLRQTPRAWHWFALGSAAALLVQVIVGAWQLITQSTALTTALGLDWPGSLLPTTHGASIVGLPDGTRWLRLYGTLPHPNLLGGVALLFLGILLTHILTSFRWRSIAAGLFDIGLALLALTFSRSAWVGLAVLLAVLLVRWRRVGKLVERRDLLLLTLGGALCLAIVVISLYPFFVARLPDSPVPTEQISTSTRLWLMQRTKEIILEHPVLGIGAGSYALALAQHVGGDYQAEPVHNALALAWSELGLGGVLALVGLGAAVVAGTLRARRPTAIALSAVLLGVLAVGMFDHYLWTLAPGRLLTGALLGIWAGQVYADDGPARQGRLARPDGTNESG